MSNKKVIKFYTVSQYGNTREFIHPDHTADGKIIAQLTGQKTINSQIRELIRDLTGCQVDFAQVAQPSACSLYKIVLALPGGKTHTEETNCKDRALAYYNEAQSMGYSATLIEA